MDLTLLTQNSELHHLTIVPGLILIKSYVLVPMFDFANLRVTS